MDIENARQRILIQESELNQRVDGMAARTVEELQRTLETTHTEAAARFVSRMREQVAPVLEEAKADLQKLVDSQTTFKEESQAIYARVTSELESGVNAKLMQTHDELDNSSAAVLTECNEKLLELSQTFENGARDSILHHDRVSYGRCQKEPGRESCGDFRQFHGSSRRPCPQLSRIHRRLDC